MPIDPAPATAMRTFSISGSIIRKLWRTTRASSTRVDYLVDNTGLSAKSTSYLQGSPWRGSTGLSRRHTRNLAMIVKWPASTQSMGMGMTKGRALAEEVNRLNNPRWNRLDSGVHIHQY